MGQTHVKGARPMGEGEHYPVQSGTPPGAFTPGSPLTYSPQMPMEPLAARADSSRIGLPQTEFAGWGAQPKVVPTVIAWTHGGQDVGLEGSWDGWSTRHAMQRTGKDFSLVKLLSPGIYQYKFIVDGQWRHDPNLTCMYDEVGNINNVLEVAEFVPENLASLSGFDPPASPTASYNCPLPSPDEAVKEPPTAPPQLALSLLNVPPAMDAVAALPRPQHVVLNHLYLQRASSSTNALVLGATRRYRSKYVTVVVYKPRRRRGATDARGSDPSAAASASMPMDVGAPSATRSSASSRYAYSPHSTSNRGYTVPGF